MTQKSNTVYPLSEKTVHKVFLKIFYPLTKNQSVTVSVRTHFGGVRNILRFFIDRYEYLADQVELDLNTSNWKFLYFDSDLLLD